jgi:hypothetical protein
MLVGVSENNVDSHISLGQPFCTCQIRHWTQMPVKWTQNTNVSLYAFLSREFLRWIFWCSRFYRYQKLLEQATSRGHDLDALTEKYKNDLCAQNKAVEIIQLYYKVCLTALLDRAFSRNKFYNILGQSHSLLVHASQSFGDEKVDWTQLHTNPSSKLLCRETKTALTKYSLVSLHWYFPFWLR